MAKLPDGGHGCASIATCSPGAGFLSESRLTALLDEVINVLIAADVAPGERA
jgi:hypothetical protein